MYRPGPPAALPLGERPRGSVVDSCGHLVLIVRDVGPQELADCLAVNRLVRQLPAALGILDTLLSGVVLT